MRRVDSACLLGPAPDHWRSEILCRAGDIERHPGPQRAMLLRGRDVLLQYVLPSAAQHSDVAISEFENCLRVGKIHRPKKLVSHELNDIRSASL